MRYLSFSDLLRRSNLLGEIQKTLVPGPESFPAASCLSICVPHLHLMSLKVFWRWFLTSWSLHGEKNGYVLLDFLQICETYPRELYVPRIASKPIIVGSSKFRSKGRFPVLSYYHEHKEVRKEDFLFSFVNLQTRCNPSLGLSILKSTRFYIKRSLL